MEITKNESMDINEIIIQGPIVSVIENDVATNIRIKTIRTNLPSQSGNFKKDDTPLFNYPTIAFYDPLLKVTAGAFKLGDEVKIHAYVDVHQKLSKITNTMYYEQRIVGLKIKRASSVFEREFGIKDNNECEQYSIFRFKGEITKIAKSGKSNNTVSINIRTFVGRALNNIQTTIYTYNADEFISKYHVGDNVTAIGNIQTVSKQLTDDYKINRTNFIIRKFYGEND